MLQGLIVAYFLMLQVKYLETATVYNRILPMEMDTSFKSSSWLKTAAVLLLAGCFSLAGAQAQNAGLGTSNPDASALFELSSTDRGFLVPRMTSGQRDLITLPANSLLIYNTSLNQFQYNTGTPGAPDWQTVVTLDLVNSSFWGTTGNAGSNPATNYVGTSDAQAFVLRTDATERMRILATGNVGIGANNPLELLSVGPNSEFRVNSSGQIVAAAGIVSTGDIDLAVLNVGGLVSAAPGTGRLGLATAGTDYESPLTFGNGMQRTGNTVGLGGSMTTNTVIATAGFNVALDGAGRLGLGVSDPLLKLDINGAIRIGDAALATSGVIRWSGTDFEGHNGTSWQSLTSGGGSSSGWNLTGNTTANTDFLGTLNLQDLRFRTNNIQRMLLSSTGNLGVGLSNPQQMLDIAGGLRLGNTVIATSGSVRWTGLDFEGHDGSGWISLTRSSVGWTVTGNTISPGDYFGTINAQDLPIRTNGVERMRITTSGNVGIGTTNPSVALEVQGSVQFGVRGTAVANIIKATVNADFGNVNSQNTRTETITVTGARVGSTVFISAEAQLPFSIIIGHAFVTADDTIEIKLVNPGLQSVNLGAQDYYVTVIE